MDARMTVYVPGVITQIGNVYDDITIPTESHKRISHQFSPTPAGDDSANHFCFVQRIKGSFKRADGSYFTTTMYGNTVPANFTNWVIDSVDDDPAYWSGYPHYNHEWLGGNVVTVRPTTPTDARFFLNMRGESCDRAQASVRPASRHRAAVRELVSDSWPLVGGGRRRTSRRKVRLSHACRWR